MRGSHQKKIFFLLPVIFALQVISVAAQSNLLLNGGFEDINTCTEYNSECGVEAWFYLRDVKAQMLENESGVKGLDHNSFGLYFNWSGQSSFAPLIGTILPCHLQKDQRYTFSGIFRMVINDKLMLRPGIVLGEKFFVPKRTFAASMKPDTIREVQPIPKTNFFRFHYSFTATGDEKYLTFGTYVEEDTIRSKHAFIGSVTITMVVDNFELRADGRNETYCDGMLRAKEAIYQYNYRHKDMDYALFGKGELPIKIPVADSSTETRIVIEPAKPRADTLKLGDVLFDFNKSTLKPEALVMLEKYFLSKQGSDDKVFIDSIHIEGHTDSIGSDSRNLQLSLDRCGSVSAWLTKNNIISSNDIHVSGFGRSKPIAPNKTPQGRALNRRVELIIFRRI